jgi:hypothetical protein
MPRTYLAHNADAVARGVAPTAEAVASAAIDWRRPNLFRIHSAFGGRQTSSFVHPCQRPGDTATTSAASNSPSGRCSASSTGPQAAGPGRPRPPALNSDAQRQRLECAGASRHTSSDMRTPSRWRANEAHQVDQSCWFGDYASAADLSKAAERFGADMTEAVADHGRREAACARGVARHTGASRPAETAGRWAGGPRRGGYSRPPTSCSSSTDTVSRPPEATPPALRRRPPGSPGPASRNRVLIRRRSNRRQRFPRQPLRKAVATTASRSSTTSSSGSGDRALPSRVSAVTEHRRWTNVRCIAPEAATPRGNPAADGRGPILGASARG